jgi:hypothetical protein
MIRVFEEVQIEVTMKDHDLTILSTDASTTRSIHPRVFLTRYKQVPSFQEVADPPRLGLIIREANKWKTDG